MGRQICKRPVECADRRAGGAHNDDVVFHPKLLLGCGCAARLANLARQFGPFGTAASSGHPGNPVNNGCVMDMRENWPFFALSARDVAVRRSPPALPQNGGPPPAKTAMLPSWAEGTRSTWQRKKSRSQSRNT